MLLTYDTTLEELLNAGILSVRTFNALHSSKMESLRDVYVFMKSGNSLINIRNLGRKSKLEIDNVLDKLQTIIEKETEMNSEIKPQIKGKHVATVFERAYNDVIIENENVNAYVSSIYENAWDLHEQIFQKTAEIMVVRPELSKEENILFRKYHLDILEAYLTYLNKEKNLNASNICEIVRPIIENISIHCEEFSLYDISINFLTKEQRSSIEQRYEQMCSQELGVRAQNFKAAFIKSFDVLVYLFDKPLSAYANLCPGQNMKKTLSEIYKFNQSFKKVFLKMYTMDAACLKVEEIKNKYPFLSQKQRTFIIDFMDKNNTPPIFYLLFNYLRVSDVRADMLYCLFYGIFDNYRHSIDEIAESIQLTRERVRQIIYGTIPAVKTIGIDERSMNQYDKITHQPFLYEDAEEIYELKEREHIKCSFYSFASIIQLILPYRLFCVSKTTSILVRNDVADKIQIKSIIEQITSIANAKYSQSRTVRIDPILDKIPTELISGTKKLVCYIFKHIHHLNMPNDSTVFIPQNCIDIEYEMYNILEKAGTPMHVGDLFKAFKEKYPSHKYVDPIQIKPYLLKSDRINSIGKTSTYALASWNDVYFGSIRNLLIDILSSFDEPVHINTIMRKIMSIYPKTNQSSIESTMQADTMDRFMAFENGLYGLSNRQYDERFIPKCSIRRIPFEEKLQNYITFVEMYHRFPSAVGGENETSLQRWHYNIVNGIISLPTEQRKKFDDMLLAYKDSGYPRTQTENEFRNKCVEYKKFIRERHILPTSKDGDDLYFWFRRSLEKFNGYSDQRYDYFKDLIEYIESYGFSILQKSK